MFVCVCVCVCVCDCSAHLMTFTLICTYIQNMEMLSFHSGTCKA